MLAPRRLAQADAQCASTLAGRRRRLRDGRCGEGRWHVDAVLGVRHQFVRRRCEFKCCGHTPFAGGAQCSPGAQTATFEVGAQCSPGARLAPPSLLRPHRVQSHTRPSLSLGPRLRPFLAETIPLHIESSRTLRLSPSSLARPSLRILFGHASLILVAYTPRVIPFIPLANTPRL